MSARLRSSSNCQLLFIALFAAIAAAGTLAAAEPRRPNVIVVLVDDLGWADIGANGSTFYETPNIDRLAGEGIRFTDGYAACAVCSPTRAALLTGRTPARTGVTDWLRPGHQGAFPGDGRNPTEYVGAPQQRLLCPPVPRWMELEEITIAEILKGAGYATGHVGKWHLGPEKYYPEHQGFDVNRGGCDFGQPPSYFDPYANKNLKGIPTLPPRKAGEYLTEREADEAVNFIRAHRDKPFYLQVCHYCVHTPLMAPEEVRAKYAAKSNSSPQKNAVYAAMVASVDDALGRIMAALNELDLTENTLVIFTSDNGGLVGPTSNVPLRAGKGTPFEGGLRVPFIFHWPGRIKAKQVSAVPIQTIDLFPTLIDAAGIEVTFKRPIDGVNLMPVLTGRGALAPRSLTWHFPHYRLEWGPWAAIRRGNLKLIRWFEGDQLNLFDLAADPRETRDLAAEMPDQAQRLNEELAAYLAQVGAKLPRPNPRFAPR